MLLLWNCCFVAAYRHAIFEKTVLQTRECVLVERFEYSWVRVSWVRVSWILVVDILDVPQSSSQSYVSNLGNEYRNAGKSRFGKGWPPATKQIFPVMFASEPSNHKGGDPFLMRALGSQYCSSSPSGQARIENLGNCRALESPPKQDTHKPYEAESYKAHRIASHRVGSKISQKEMNMAKAIMRVR